MKYFGTNPGNQNKQGGCVPLMWPHGTLKKSSWSECECLRIELASIA